MTPGPEHLIIAPILIPFFAGALMLVYDERQRRAKLTISLVAVLASLLAALELLVRSKGSELTGNNDIGFYLLGDWAAPWGIILVIDRLSATAGTALGRPVVCDLGLAAADLPAMVGEAPGTRVVTLYGILPGMAAFEAMAAALALLRPGDMLALSANLLPEGDGAMERIVAQYDNAP